MNPTFCRLCLKARKLQKSHLLPAALYGARKKDFEVHTVSGVTRTQTQMKQPLLCSECEQRFNQKGEDHVLKAIAPKSKKHFPLHARMRVAFARESDPSVSRFHGPDFGLDTNQFAYFAISVIWRVAVAQWEMQDGTFTRKVDLGDYEEEMRRFLVGELALPDHMVVIVIVCSDTESRRWFFVPGEFIEAGCINFRFLARGVYFRVMLGHSIDPTFQNGSCTAPLKCVYYGDCERRTLQDTEGRYGRSTNG